VGDDGFLPRDYIGVQEKRVSAGESKGELPGTLEANPSGAGAATDKRHDYINRSRRETELSDDPMFMYVGDYESIDDAKADLTELKQLHREHVVGTFDAAVLTKDEKGKVKVVEKIEKPTQHGGWAGLAVGAAVGVIFPPSLLVSGLAGAGAGALIGHLEGGMSRSDLKEIGEMLDDSEAALVVVGEATIERVVEEQTKRAKKEMKKEVRADAREMEKAIDRA
jgi:uncharacterized membrane protein